MPTPTTTPPTTPPTRLQATTAKPPPPPPIVGRECYNGKHVNTANIELFADILDPTNGFDANATHNIFFHETTCLHGEPARLKIRQACAVESAARTNPNSHVYLLYASTTGLERGAVKPAIFAALSRYANVRVRNVNLWTYTNDTPADLWWQHHSGDLFASGYMSVHMSDLLRLVSLYRWGGIYMDLDFVVRRSFDQMPATFGSEEIPGYVANAMMGYGRHGVGHMIVGELLSEFVRHYNPHVFAANGPALLKRVFRDLCGTDKLRECTLIKIFPKEVFYAVYGTEWERLFDKEHAVDSMRRFNESMAVHMWNALTAGVPVRLGENSAYERLAREFCPEVLATAVGGEF